MEEYKTSDQDAVLYNTDTHIGQDEVLYSDRKNIGGARLAVHMEDERTYALTTLEYTIIKTQIPNQILNNNQSLLLSIGSSFLFSSVVYGITTPFYIQKDGKDLIKWITIVFFIIFISLAISSLIAFVFSLFTKKNQLDPFKLVEEKIIKCLGIK